MVITVLSIIIYGAEHCQLCCVFSCLVVLLDLLMPYGNDAVLPVFRGRFTKICQTIMDNLVSNVPKNIGEIG